MNWQYLLALPGWLFLGSFSTSTHYQLQSYGVNSGGTNSSTSATYSAQATAGGTTGSASTSPTYSLKAGSIQAQQASVPTAPTLSNGSSTYYNKLNFIINTASNPTDATYSVAVSTSSSFTVTNYVQSNGTLGSSKFYQTYSAWGGASGSLAIGLAPNTAYWFKVDAITGKFTNSAYGPSATISTVNPSLSFSLSPSVENLGNLNAGSVITSPSNLSFTFTTNSANGGIIYGAGQFTGLKSASNSYTIQVSPPSGDLSSLSEGFGLQGLTASAPLTIQSPYNGTSNVVGAIYTTFQPIFSSTTSVASGTATANLLAKAATTDPAGSDYTDTLTFIAAAIY